jgi:hypothetical protein
VNLKQRIALPLTLATLLIGSTSEGQVTPAPGQPNAAAARRDSLLRVLKELQDVGKSVTALSKSLEEALAKSTVPIGPDTVADMLAELKPISVSIRKSSDPLDRLRRGINTAARQTKTNLKFGTKRVIRVGSHFIRWITEDNCDRVGRKDGPEAQRKCEQDNKNQRASSANETNKLGRFHATLEIDCWKPGNDSRWGTSSSTAWSDVSTAAAERLVMQHVNTFDGNVCRQRWRDENLYDGDRRWTHK